MKSFIVLLLIVVTYTTQAQHITLSVVTDKKVPSVISNVWIREQGILKQVGVPNILGVYYIRTASINCFDLLVCAPGFDSVCVQGIPIPLDRYASTKINITLSKPVAGCNASIVALLYTNAQPDTRNNKYLFIEPPQRALVQFLPGVETPHSSSQRPGTLSIAGARTSGTIYFIDTLVPTAHMENNLRVDRTQFNYPGHYLFSGSNINRMPYSEVRDIAATLPGVYQKRRGDELHIYGSR